MSLLRPEGCRSQREQQNRPRLGDEMVLNVYTHVSDERKREAATRIGETLLGR